MNRVAAAGLAAGPVGAGRAGQGRAGQGPRCTICMEMRKQAALRAPPRVSCRGRKGELCCLRRVAAPRGARSKGREAVQDAKQVECVCIAIPHPPCPARSPSWSFFLVFCLPASASARRPPPRRASRRWRRRPCKLRGEQHCSSGGLAVPGPAGACRGPAGAVCELAFCLARDTHCKPGGGGGVAPRSATNHSGPLLGFVPAHVGRKTQHRASGLPWRRRRAKRCRRRSRHTHAALVPRVHVLRTHSAGRVRPLRWHARDEQTAYCHGVTRGNAKTLSSAPPRECEELAANCRQVARAAGLALCR